MTVRKPLILLNGALSELPSGDTLQGQQSRIEFEGLLYGVLNNAKTDYNAAITSGAAILTSSSNPFTAADVGKKIKIYDITNSAFIANTTILSYQNAGQVTLNANASATLSAGNGIAAWGTDTNSHIQAGNDAIDDYVGTNYGGPNFSYGRGAAKLRIPVTSDGDACFISSQVTFSHGVRLEADAQILNNVGHAATNRTYAMDFTSGAHIEKLNMQCFGGMGIQVGESSGNVQSQSIIGNLILWNVGTNYDVAQTPDEQKAVELLGYDHLIDQIWLKGGNIGIHHNVVSDVYADRYTIIGSSTGCQLTTNENVGVSQMVLDTISYNAVDIEGSRNVSLKGRIFSYAATTLTYGILIGEYDTTNKNRNIVLDYQLQRTGGTGAKVSNIEDSWLRFNMTNAAFYGSVGGNISTAITYGSGNAGSLYIEAVLDGAITTRYSGTRYGCLLTVTDGTWQLDADAIKFDGGPVTIMNQNQLRLSELTSNGANYIALRAPASLSSDYTYTLPSSYGTNLYFLQTDGSGGLTWAAHAAASETASGIVELATSAEINTGTDATRAMSPDAFAGSNPGTRVIGVLVSDPLGSAITTGDGKACVRIPSVMNGMNLVGVAGSVTTVSSSGIPTVQLRRNRRTNATTRSDADMLSTKLTIDASEYDSSDAAAAAAINTSNDDVQTNDLIFIDIDVAGTGAKGLYVEMQFQLP